jgi:hypothetical protein
MYKAYQLTHTLKAFPSSHSRTTLESHQIHKGRFIAYSQPPVHTHSHPRTKRPALLASLIRSQLRRRFRTFLARNLRQYLAVNIHRDPTTHDRPRYQRQNSKALKHYPRRNYRSLAFR